MKEGVSGKRKEERERGMERGREKKRKEETQVTCKENLSKKQLIFQIEL